MRSVSSIFASSRRLVSLGLCLGLAACGSSQNWEDNSQFVTVGVSVTGFTGGSLALWNNGADKLTIPGNGAFKFPLQIARGSNYAVVVATQPAGQICTVTNGIGTANGDAFDATVKCVPYTFTRRPLPAIYTTGKAVNYSPYRTAGGPAELEVPSDIDILQDLTLLNTAGYNLLRLFGAKAPATDVVAEKILRIAAQTFPDMKFQLGLDLKGLTSCSQTDNDFNIAYLISNLSKYPNVVTISVGNETSFFSKFMPLPCLEGYIRTIRAQVTQPVTTDDDWTFYAGRSVGGGDRVPVKPDTILPLIDFASIHMYPISYPDGGNGAVGWDWRQTSVPEGPARAQAMMEESLATLKQWHGEVVDYQYVGADGVTVSVGEMPITVGETGWKARQTNPSLQIESFAAREANQKWYVDLLYGNPDGYESWQGSAGGPPAIFYFQAFDEQWKGIDDGWGLWNIERQARYALCGTPAGPACKDDLYEGAGYYVQSAFSTITFDSPDINYSFLDFGGTGGSAVVADPIGGANKVARVIRSDAALEFAGTVVGTSGDTVGIIPFDADNTQMTVRVYSPAAGIPVRLKIEDSSAPAGDPGFPEAEVATTTANAWETLTFDFANPVAGSLNLDFNYDKLVIFFNFGAKGEDVGVQTYYFDDMEFIGGGGGGGGGGAIVFASGYKSNNRTVEDGEWGFYSGNFTSFTQTITGGGFVDADPPVSAADSYVFQVVLTSAPTTDGFMGIYTMAPGYTGAAPNAGVTLDGQTNLKIELGMAAEWFQQASNKALTVRTIGSQVYSNGAGGLCQILVEKQVTPTTADLVTYTVALNSMTLAQACNGGGFTSGVTTLEQALASPIGEIHVQAIFPQVNTTVPAGAEYPTGFTRGSVSFE